MVVILAFILAVQLPSLWWVRPVVRVVDWKPVVDLRTVVRPGVNTTLIQTHDICGGGDPSSKKNLFLLVVVFSSTTNWERRQAIRRTWASREALVATPMPLPTDDEKTKSSSAVRSSSVERDRIRVVFLLGTGKDDSYAAVEAESRRHGDLVQEDFVDSYDNLTVKAAMMLKWVTTAAVRNGDCDGPSFVMKTDDDTFVNVGRLVDTLASLDADELNMIGCVICNGRVVRNIYDKFYVPPSVVSATFYPDYLSGSGYVMPRRVTGRLYEAIFRTPFLFLEDVYVTGMCTRNLDVRVRLSNEAGFSSSWMPRPMDPCVFHYAVTAHHMTATDMDLIWTRMRRVTVQDCGPQHLELSNAQRSRCGENWFLDYVNSFS